MALVLDGTLSRDSLTPLPITPSTPSANSPWAQYLCNSLFASTPGTTPFGDYGATGKGGIHWREANPFEQVFAKQPRGEWVDGVEGYPMLRVDLNTMTTSPADSSLAFGTPELVPSSQSIASSEAPLSHLAPRLPTQYFADFDPISPLDVVDPTWPTSSAAPRVVASTSASIPHTSLAAPTPIVTLPVPNSLQLHSKASPLVPYKGRKRGRKPKDAVAEEVVQLDPAEEEARKADALERNRIAASKSRRKKKEKVFEMESAITSLSTTNESLQADCRILQMEMLELRRLVTSLHPVEAGCSCTHVVGYLAREAAGGGIPTIDRLAGETLTRDYPAFKDLIGKEPTEHKFVEAEEPVKVEKKRKPVVEDTFVERAPIPIKRRKA